MRKREWLNYEVHRRGDCEAWWNGEPWRASYEVGCYFSGRSRVYEGVFTKLTTVDGREWLGTDRWNYVKALRSMFACMSQDGLQLICAGLDDRYYTTGLSDGTGFGYLAGLEDEGAFHILDPVEGHAATKESDSRSNR